MLCGGNWSNGSGIDKQIGCKPTFKPISRSTADDKIQHQSDVNKLYRSIDNLTTWIVILVVMLIIYMIGGH